jgi:hypothetical protein
MLTGGNDGKEFHVLDSAKLVCLLHVVFRQFLGYLYETSTWCDGLSWEVSLIYRMVAIQRDVIAGFVLLHGLANNGV